MGNLYSNDRTLLSYSKSLGVCLLKYNEYIDNELHICLNDQTDYVVLYDIEDQNCFSVSFNIEDGLVIRDFYDESRKIILQNFIVDISNNDMLDSYLNEFTGKGKKRRASPEKDKEVLLMQLPYGSVDMVISEYISSVYLLYGLYMRYGMNGVVFEKLCQVISELEDFRFASCDKTERCSLLVIINYLYRYGMSDIEMCKRIYNDSREKFRISAYYDPILQLHGIQVDNFEDSYSLSDYNSNIISDWIWDIYSKFRFSYNK